MLVIVLGEFLAIIDLVHWKRGTVVPEFLTTWLGLLMEASVTTPGIRFMYDTSVKVDFRFRPHASKPKQASLLACSERSNPKDE